MASILDFIKNEQVLEYARRLDPTVYFGFELFPQRMVQEIDYSYIKGVGGRAAVMLAEVVPWESAAPVAPHESLTRVEGELPPIKQKRRFSEKEVVRIFSPRSTAERNAIIARLYRDTQANIDGIYGRVNSIIMEALGKGTSTLAGDGVKLTVDWGIPSDQKVVKIGDGLWDNYDTANPIADMQALQTVILDATGYMCDTALTSSTIIAHLLQNEVIKKAFFGPTWENRIMTLIFLNDFLVSIGLPTISSYDEKCRTVNPDQTLGSARYYPETSFSMFPHDVQLGETLVGPTAEALLGIGAEEAPGVYAEVWETRDPIEVWSYAVGTMFPTFPGADSVGIIVPLTE